MTLGRRALTLRVAHAAIAIVELTCLTHLWMCAVTGRRDRALVMAVAVLAAEGTVLIACHGDCPLGPLQRHLGDPIPLFELVLSPRTAKDAVPALSVASCAGLALLALRGSRSVTPSAPALLCPCLNPS